MPMPVSVGQGPQPDFDHPIELMMDCHRRIEKFLDVLDRVAAKNELDAEHRRALRTALNYFNSAGPRHNHDEEGDLFPALSAFGGAAARLVEKMDRLAAEHRMAEEMHARLNQLGRKWLKSRRLSEVDLAEFRILIERLMNFYAAHIATEENDVFPMAAAVLSPETLRQIGQNMRARRIENPGRHGSRCARRRKKRL
jgi:hemerythrin-like domain-containing protein